MASQNRTQQLESFRDALNPEIESGYYPACGNDSAPWDVFPEANIVGVDLDEYSIKRLRERGAYPLFVDDVNRYRHTESVDALFLFGWGNYERLSSITDLVRPGGYVLTDGFVLAGEVAGVSKDIFDIFGRVTRDRVVETERVDRGEVTGLGIMKYLQDQHTTPRAIGTICLELELTMPDMYRSNLIILRRIDHR